MFTTRSHRRPLVPPEDCPICQDRRLADEVLRLKAQGWGYRRITDRLAVIRDVRIPRDTVADHCASHLGVRGGTDAELDPLASIGAAEDNAERIVDIKAYFANRGIEMPPEGWVVPAATIEERGQDGQRHWVRVRPEGEDPERIEIRQAEPIIVDGIRPSPTIIVPGNWYTALISPDAQIGYFQDRNGAIHPIHDERCFDVGHQVALAVAADEGLDAWVDVGDFLDLAAISKYAPTAVDPYARCLNAAFERGSEELARRRFAVGDAGTVVVLDANHTDRFRRALLKEHPYLIGMKRGGDPEDEHPVLSVPYLVRARDYRVEWYSVWPSGYFVLNDNFVAVHSPAYGSQALSSAQKIANKIHASVVFGHIHRREQLALTIQTPRNGARTYEVFSDGCWARIDGALPSERNTYDDYGDRKTSLDANDKVGYLSEQMDQGFSIAHIERDGRQRFSVERIVIWDGWAQFRGQDFIASVDIEGRPLEVTV